MGEVDRVLKQLNEIYDKIENIDPEYVSLRRAKIISLNEIQNMLSYKGRGAVLVEYFVTKHETFIFVVTRNEFHIKTAQLSKVKLAQFIQSYRREVMQYTTFGYIGNTWMDISSYLID